MIRDVAAAPSQDEVDELLREIALPIKSRCGHALPQIKWVLPTMASLAKVNRPGISENR